MTMAIILVLGLCFGSFVNAMVWRIHEQSQSKKKRSVSTERLSIINGRSMCPRCHHTLAWYDLLPLVSWFSLRGKCRYCRQTISWQYPLVETVTAVLFVLSYAFWPFGFDLVYSWVLFALWLILLVAFVALAVYDLRWMILPNRIVFPMQAVALVYLLVRLAAPGMGTWTHAVYAGLSLLCSAGLFYAIFQVSEGKWIGGGDVKLAVILGLVLGNPYHTLLMLFIASTLGSIVGIPLLFKGKAKHNTKLPFGPFLIAGTIIVQLFGAGIISWYMSSLMFI